MKRSSEELPINEAADSRFPSGSVHVPVAANGSVSQFALFLHAVEFRPHVVRALITLRR